VLYEEQIIHWIGLQQAANGGRISPTALVEKLNGKVKRRTIYTFLVKKGYIQLKRGVWVKPKTNQQLSLKTVSPWYCSLCNSLNESQYSQTCIACDNPHPDFQHLRDLKGEPWICTSCRRECSGHEQLCPNCGLFRHDARDIKTEVKQAMPILGTSMTGLSDSHDYASLSEVIEKTQEINGNKADLKFTVIRGNLWKTLSVDSKDHMVQATLEHLTNLIDHTVYKIIPSSTTRHRSLSRTAANIAKGFFAESKRTDGLFSNMYHLHYKKVAIQSLRLTMPLFMTPDEIQRCIYELCPTCKNEPEKRKGCETCNGIGNRRTFSYDESMMKQLRKTKTYATAMMSRVATLIEELMTMKAIEREKYRIGDKQTIKRYYRSKHGPPKQPYWVINLAAKIDLLNIKQNGSEWPIKHTVEGIRNLHKQGMLKVTVEGKAKAPTQVQFVAVQNRA
jgi:hypothetical protein